MTRIWILEANNILLNVSARWLHRAGHTIVMCPSWESVLRRASRIRTGRDLLILDLSSADYSATALILKARVPVLKGLFISDAAVSDWSVRQGALFHALAPAMSSALQKPFTGPELLSKVDELIGSPTPRRRIERSVHRDLRTASLGSC